MKIGIMGYYPPPEGGISMHVKRLAGLLSKNNIDYHIYAYGQSRDSCEEVTRFTNRRRFALSYIKAKKEDIIHCHIMGWSEKAFYLLAAKGSGKKMLYTFHSYRDGLKTVSRFQKLCFYVVRRFGDCFIAVSRKDEAAMIADGFPKRKIYYIPGFIAPVTSIHEEQGAIHPRVEAFMASYPTFLTANASNNNHYMGEDLYGLDLCIQLMARLKEDGMENIGFVFYLSQVTDRPYYEKLLHQIQELGLEERFLLMINGGQYYPILTKAAAFIRPTNTDGDAISIREALYVGCPVIASDCVERPEGTMLFKNRDSNRLTEAVKDVLKNRGNHPQDSYGKEYGQDVIRVYYELYKGNRGDKHE